MTWVRFGRDEPPAPALTLRDAAGARFSSADCRGRSAVVVFFACAADCADCRRAARELDEARAEFRALEAETVSVWPAGAPAPGWLDPDGAARRRFAALLEWDTRGQPLLFVLDLHGAPAAAWVDDHARVGDLASGVRTQLERLELRCPE